MRIAIPMENGQASAHFGRCSEFAILDVARQEKKVVKKEVVSAPAHQPGLLPGWLGEQGVQMVISTGMGMRAQSLLDQLGIQVITGAGEGDPESIADDFLNNLLTSGENVCDNKPCHE